MAASAGLDAGTLIINVPKSACISGVSAHCEEVAAIAAKCTPVLDLVFEKETDWWRLIITVLVEQVRPPHQCDAPHPPPMPNATRHTQAGRGTPPHVECVRQAPPCGGLTQRAAFGLPVPQAKYEKGEASYWGEMLRTVGAGGASPDASSYQWCALSEACRRPAVALARAPAGHCSVS